MEAKDGTGDWIYEARFRGPLAYERAYAEMRRATGVGGFSDETRPTQATVLKWAVDNFGTIALNRDERAARLAEEAMEVAQAEGVPAEVVQRILARVYSRPPGELGQEIGGCGITLLALAENAGIDHDAEVLREWRRVLSKSRDWWQRKHAEKVAAGTANLSPTSPLNGKGD